MTAHFADGHLTVHIGDCRAVMAEMEPASVHCVVTSPPYWGLRDYGTATWDGGDAACDHARRPNSDGCLACGADMNDQTPGCAKCEDRHLKRTLRGTPDKDYNPPDAKRAELPNPPASWAERDVTVKPGTRCRKCGARRIDAQLGLEPTPEEYVANMVGVFREVRRVLRDDGTVWLNLGDSYVANGSGQVPQTKDHKGSGFAGPNRDGMSGLAPKNLVGIPWRVAFALQADGWYLRSDIIWSKPNPMPESVTDRPTKAHEYVFLLSKSPRYYFDAEVVRESSDWGRVNNPEWAVQRSETNARKHPTNRNAKSGGFTEWQPENGRNLRSVWTIATQPYPGAHFATFPEKLVEPCVKAGCPSDGVVLDPFAGSGTVGRVANRLGRRAVLIDLSADYIDQAMLRNAQAPLGLGA